MPRGTLSFDLGLPTAVLDIADKTRGNPLAWRGQFSPQFVEALISNYAPGGAHVLDPFVGSGTVLFEAASLGHRATGVEINPAAAALAMEVRFLHEKNEDSIDCVENAEEKKIQQAIKELAKQARKKK